MNSTISNLVTLVGRILMAAIFVYSGFQKLGAFAATAGYIASKGLPLPEVGVVIAIVVEIGAGLALIVGFKARLAALALALFALAAGVLFHNYWTLPADKQLVDMIMFWKNLSIAGGLLMVYVFGAGGWSIDARSGGK